MQKIKEIWSIVGQKLAPILVKRNIPYLVIGFFAVLTLILVGSAIKRAGGSTDIVIAPAKATQSLDKEFSFPLKNDKSEEVSRIKYIIENVEKRDEIVVKGQRARSVKGRTFLIFNLKIVNDFNQVIQIQTRDYVRLSVNGDKNQWLAPDIHNDPVDIQAISTKLTRIGFAINDSDKNIVLRVGEINGEKEEIEIKI